MGYTYKTKAELTFAEGLTWNAHPDVYLAKEIMPDYVAYSEYLTPMEFIKLCWGESSDGVRLQMIEYIDKRPFDGCERYIQEWQYYLDHNNGRVLSLF